MTDPLKPAPSGEDVNAEMLAALQAADRWMAEVITRCEGKGAIHLLPLGYAARHQVVRAALQIAKRQGPAAR